MGQSRNEAGERACVWGFSPAPSPPPVAADSQWANATHLIIVAGHTVFMGTDFSGPSAETERDWYLLGYQQGQLSWFIDHIKSGIAKAAQGEKQSEPHYEK